MRVPRRLVSRLAMVSVGSFLLSLPAPAQVSSEPGASPAPHPASGSRGPVSEHGESFGTGDASVTWLSMANFQPRHTVGHEMTYVAFGYQRRSGGENLLWAPLDLPNGAIVDSVRLYANDGSVLSNVIVLMARFVFPGSGVEDLGFAATSGDPGVTEAAFDPAVVIDNSDGAYVIYLDLPVDGAVSARGVRVLWRRQVSPAPATATFGDVPLSHIYFRAIEAMAASKITAGCGTGNFCPEQNVTRGEIAAFFARALGLHFPY